MLVGTSINGELQVRSQAGACGDGNLDLSNVVEVRPLDRAQPTGLVEFGDASRTVPDADATPLPPTLHLIGGRPLSSLLPGGIGACTAHNDKDVLDGVTGWWCYLNFPAVRVPVSAPAAPIFSDGFEP